MDDDWLKSLKPGDDVAYNNNRYGYNPDYMIVTVVRVTPTGQIVTRDGRGFEKRWKRGSAKISDFHTAHLIPATEEIKKVISIRTMRRSLSIVKWDIVSDEKVEAVYRIMATGK